MPFHRWHRRRGEPLVIRESRVVKIVLYWYRERALADLGLSPEGGAPD
jgi:hypothetical protein